MKEETTADACRELSPAQECFEIFRECTEMYHETDDVDAECPNPFPDGSIQQTLFAKNWVDAVQWHLEDIIRDPNIDPVAALALKIYHMQAEVDRDDADADHRARCAAKLAVLTEQRSDLTTAIDQLLDDIAAGRKYMKVYRQMKMYNDPATNPVLYAAKK